MRQKKGQSVKFQRVESVEVIELKDRERIKELCPEGKVYDLELDKNSNYFANDMLVHNCSAFPKPAKRTKAIRKRFRHIPCILMSGTPAAESGSQYYHQFWVSKYSPFAKYKNFYRWSDHYVTKVRKRFGTHEVTDYSNAHLEQILKDIDHLTVRMTRKGAGIEMEAEEIPIEVDTPPEIDALAKRLIKERAIEGQTGILSAETPAKLQSKVHQIYNGSVIIENDEGESMDPVILSHYKAEFIRDRFAGKKLAVMFFYRAELKILEDIFGDNLTTDLDEFNSTDKHIALQQSSIEGMNLSKADVLVFYNLGFSAKNYLQALTRLTVKGRKDNKVYFLIEKGGINGKILKALHKKESYHSKSFKRDFIK